MPENIEIQFHEAMINIYRQALSQCGYKATRFLNMVNEKGGLEAAKILLHSDKVSEGYVELYMRGRLDLTMEALVIKPEWSELFSSEEKKIAMKRLEDYGYRYKV